MLIAISRVDVGLARIYVMLEKGLNLILLLFSFSALFGLFILGGCAVVVLLYLVYKGVVSLGTWLGIFNQGDGWDPKRETETVDPITEGEKSGLIIGGWEGPDDY